MRLSRYTALHAVVGLALALGLSQLTASSTQSSGPPPAEYVHFSGHSQASLWFPDPAEYPDPTIGVIKVHRTGNRMNHVAMRELPARGFVALGLNTHAANNEGALRWEERMPIDIKAGVEFMYDEVGVEKVVLMGGSGGGPNFAFYQAIAENGLDICQGPGKIVECPDDENLIGPPADAMIYRDTHPGNPVNRLRRLNAAVRSERNPERLSANLNPFLERNGFNPDGCSSYSEEFQQRYNEAQSQRMERLTDEALKIQAAIDAGTHFPTDGDAFLFYRNSARLMDLDNTIEAETHNPRKLVTDDRDIVTDIVQTVRPCGPPLGYSSKEHDASYGGARDITVTSFLGTHAIRSNDSMDDIDHCSTNNSTFCMVQSIEAPTLVTAAQGNIFMRDGEELFELAASPNKDYVVFEGATHGMGNCAACDGAPYFNVRENFYDYLAEWMNNDFTPVEEMP